MPLTALMLEFTRWHLKAKLYGLQEHQATITLVAQRRTNSGLDSLAIALFRRMTNRASTFN